MDSELLSKFIFWTIFVETAVYWGCSIKVAIRKKSKLKVSFKLISTSSIHIFFVGLKWSTK